jgi:serine/threonine-protein kinase
VKDERDPVWSRWAEVDRLFECVLERPRAERTAYLEQACGGDADLRDLVLSLLEAGDRPGGLPGPSSGMLEAVFEEVAGSRPVRTRLEAGDVVDRFRVITELGRGGMATVYEAERIDGAFDQHVAIKVLDRGLDTEDVVGRFLSERQILSGLEHPNIARLLDGGSTADGHPYLVMEKVAGEPITKWADARGLSVDERLDLFGQVAEAVSHAHARLIVHRDLKPANVMVGADGRVRLLDFGIAKLLGAPSGDADATAAITQWMTPHYAAPEQILGRSVTTATDVHGLGVILYELLSGHRPFGGDATTGYELQKAICESAPERPSTVVTRTAERRDSTRPDITPADVARARGVDPVALCRELEGDLDAIVLKALRKEPDARYRTVQSLIDDIERYRTGFPVQAHAGASAYRIRKFVRRNRLATIGAATVVTVLAVASILLSAEQAATARERDRATREATNARLVIEFLADVFRGRDPLQAPPDTITARELLAWGMERIETAFADRPDVQAELLTVMGSAHFNLGLTDEGTNLHARSLAIRREVYGDVSVEVAEALSRLAAAYGAARDFEAAYPLRQEALAIRDVVNGRGSTEVGNAMRGLGSAARDVGRLDEAETVLRQAMAIHQRTAGSDSTELIADMLTLAYVLRAKDELTEAEALYDEAIPRYRLLHGSLDPDLSVHLNNLAYLHRTREDYAGAVPLYTEALDITAAVHGRAHPNALLLANNLASVLHLLGRADEVVGMLRENLDAVRAYWPDGHWRVGSAYSAYGRALLRLGRARDAEAPLDAALREYTTTLGAGHDWTAFAMAARAVCHILIGREAEGREMLDAFHAGLESRVDDAGGTVEPALVNLIEPLVRLMEETGLSDDANRLRPLLSADDPS